MPKGKKAETEYDAAAALLGMNDNPAEGDDDSLDQHPPMPPIPNPGQAPPPLAVAAVPGPGTAPQPNPIAMAGTPMAAGYPMAAAVQYGHHQPHYPPMAGMITHHAHSIPNNVPGHANMTPHYPHTHTQIHQSIPGVNMSAGAMMSAQHGHHGQFHAPPPNPSPNVNASQGASPKSRRDKFPVKLMGILSNDQYIDCIAWLPHGRSFVIHSPERFTEHVLPKITKPCKFSSFTRKLYRWGFRQISKGPDAESFFHKHFRRDKTTLCNMIVCGKEVRDGCPELHEGINAHSLMRMEQAEIRENLLLQRQEAVARQNLAHQQAMMQQAQAAAIGHVGAGSAGSHTLVGTLGTTDADLDGAEAGKEAHAQSQDPSVTPASASATTAEPSSSVHSGPQILAPSGLPVKGPPLPQPGTTVAPPPQPTADSLGPVPIMPAPISLSPSQAGANPGDSLSALAASSDSIDVQARIDAMQARILELKRRQLAELEAKHKELQLLEKEEENRIKRQAAAAKSTTAEALEEQIRGSQESELGVGSPQVTAHSASSNDPTTAASVSISLTDPSGAADTNIAAETDKRKKEPPSEEKVLDALENEEAGAVEEV